MGRVYLIEHCVYAYNDKQRQLAFEIYVTDRLKAINDSVANALGGNVTQARYLDLLEEMKGHKEEERTAEQVISSISEKLERVKNESV